MRLIMATLTRVLQQELTGVEGNLAISAIEQIEFLTRLFYNELSFAKEHQLLVKDVMVIEAGRDWILRG